MTDDLIRQVHNRQVDLVEGLKQPLCGWVVNALFGVVFDQASQILLVLLEITASIKVSIRTAMPNKLVRPTT